MERDFKAGDKILIGDGLTAHLGIVTCTQAVDGHGVHGLNYKGIDGNTGWAYAGICRKASDEEWVALVLKGK
jgi:hypothetical protein